MTYVGRVSSNAFVCIHTHVIVHVRAYTHMRVCACVYVTEACVRIDCVHYRK